MSKKAFLCSRCGNQFHSHRALNGHNFHCTKQITTNVNISVNDNISTVNDNDDMCSVHIYEDESSLTPTCTDFLDVQLELLKAYETIAH